MKNGVPFEEAFTMDDAVRFAMAVTFAGFEGQEFCWRTMRFKDRKP